MAGRIAMLLALAFVLVTFVQMYVSGKYLGRPISYLEVSGITLGLFSFSCSIFSDLVTKQRALAKRVWSLEQQLARSNPHAS